MYGVETYFEAEGEKRFSTPYAHALELLLRGPPSALLIFHAKRAQLLCAVPGSAWRQGGHDIWFLGLCGNSEHGIAVPRRSRGPPFALLIVPAKTAHLRCAVPGTAERREWCAR